MAIFFAFCTATNGTQCNKTLTVDHDVKVRKHDGAALVALPVLREPDLSAVLVCVTAKAEVSAAFHNDAVGAVTCEGDREEKSKKEDDKEKY